MKHEMLKTFLHRLKKHTEEENIEWEYEDYTTYKNKSEIKTFITEDSNDAPPEVTEIKISKIFFGLKYKLSIYPKNELMFWKWQKNFDTVQKIFELGKEQLTESEKKLKKITKALK